MLVLVNSDGQQLFCIITLAIIGYINSQTEHEQVITHAEQESHNDVKANDNIDRREFIETSTMPSNIDCNYTRRSHNNGFHRHVDTNILLSSTKPIPSQHCHVLLLEYIPAGLYIDLYQAEAAFRLGGPQVYSSVDIDVEQTAWLSNPHVVHVYSPLHVTDSQAMANISVLVHARCHRPSDSSDYIQVTLEKPHILFHCQPDIDWLVSHSTVAAPCFYQTSVTCNWTSIACTSLQESNNHLTFDVPVGKQGHYVLVIIFTIMTTVVATLLLIGVMVYSLWDSSPVQNSDKKYM